MLFRDAGASVRPVPPAGRARAVWRRRSCTFIWSEAPDELQLGSRLTVRGRRWGVTQRMVSEITAFEEGALIVEEQRQGPFRAWRHTQRFAPSADGGVRITDGIDYEPPGGVLGRLATAEAIRRELERAFAYRRERLAELLGGDLPFR